MDALSPVEHEVRLLAPPLDGEPEADYELFTFYVSLPPARRSASAVARHFGISTRRVQEVALRYNWVERARSHDLSLVAFYRGELAQKIIGSLSRLAEVVTAVSERLVEYAREAELTPNLMERMIRSLADVAAVLAQFPLPYEPEYREPGPERMTNVLTVLFNTGTQNAGTYREPIAIISPGATAELPPE